MGIVNGGDFHFLHDDRMARRWKRKGLLNKELKVNSSNQSLKRALEDQKLDGGMVDEDYACLLNLLNQMLEGGQSPKRALGDKKLDSGMVDEDYEHFLYQAFEGEFIGEDFDFLHDVRMARRFKRRGALNKELKVNCSNQSLKRALEDQKLDSGMADEDDAHFLNQKLEDRQSLKRVLEDRKSDGCMVDAHQALEDIEFRNLMVKDDDDSGEDDPDYKMFLEKLKEDGKSYVLQVAVKNELSLYKYEAEDSSDDECETPGMRKSKSVTGSEKLEAAKGQKLEAGQNCKNTRRLVMMDTKYSALEKDMTSEPVNLISGKENGFSSDNPCPINSESFEVGSEHEMEFDVDESYLIYLNGINRGIADGAVPATEDAELFEHKKKDDKCNSESEVLVAHNALDFRDGNYSPFETSKLYIALEDEDGQPCFGNPNTSSRSWYREKLMEKLSESYDQKEHNKLWEDITEQKPKERVFQFRSGVVKRCKKHTEPGGPSYLAQFRDLEKKINEVSLDKHKELNLLRGFFFWLQNLVQNDAFRPWLDPRCLEVMPRNSM